MYEDIATGNRRYGVPWTAMIGKDRIFVDREYVPIGFKFKHPRDMQKAEIVEFLHHLWLRQEKYTALKEVFRFNKITDSRKRNASITEPLYNISDAKGSSPIKQRRTPAEYEQIILGRVTIPVRIYYNGYITVTNT